MSFTVCGVSYGVDRFVSADGTGEYATIEDAVGACYTDDRVVLMPGVYTGPGNRDVQVEDDIVIMAYNFQQDTVVIDCQGSAANPWQAFVVVDGNPTFKYLTITGGYATSGGAIEVGVNNASIYKCKFVGNIAERGGAISAMNSAGLALDYCLFVNNRATIEGGAVFLFGSFSATLYKSTFVRNYSDSGSSIFVSGNANLAMTQSILVLGRGSIAVGDYYAGSITATYSDIWGNAGGDWTGKLASQLGTNDNIKADPLFCDPDAPLPNYKVSMNSPAIFLPGAAMGSAGFDDTWAVPIYGVSADGSGMFPTIQAALDTVPVPAEVVLKAGVYEGVGNRGLSFLGKDITLRSRDLDATTTSIDGGTRDRLFWFKDGETTAATISDLKLTRGHADRTSEYLGYGGGILLTHSSSVTLRRCNLFSNYGAHASAVSANTETGNLVIEDCTLNGNSNLTLLFLGRNLELNNTTIEHMYGFDTTGLWLGNWGNTVNIVNCDFVELRQGIQIDNPMSATITLTSTNFSACEKGMVVEGADDLTLIACNFSYSIGSALKATTSDLFIMASDFTQCRALGVSGGAMNMSQCTATIQDTDFSYNRSDQHGGAVFSFDSNSFFNRCNFTNNRALTTISNPNGGAVYQSSGSLGLYDSVFTGNSGGRGGAIYCIDAVFSSYSTSFIANEGLYTSALSVYHGNSSALVIENIFADNTATYLGPAVRLNADTVTVERSTFAGNIGPEGNAQIDVNSASDLIFNRNIVAHGVGIRAFHPVTPTGVWDLTCNDIFGNAGGDWVDALADYRFIGGNQSVDPFFCDPDNGVYSIWMESTCAAANNSCGVSIGAVSLTCFGVSAVGDEQLPKLLTLVGNTPNPFNPVTEIKFALPAAGAVTVTVHDLSGRVVRTLLGGAERVAGPQTIVWRGRDDSGRMVASGAYFYRVTSGSETVVGKMLLLK